MIVKEGKQLLTANKFIWLINSLQSPLPYPWYANVLSINLSHKITEPNSKFGKINWLTKLDLADKNNNVSSLKPISLLLSKRILRICSEKSVPPGSLTISVAIFCDNR